jgi:hypothetical protein
VLLENDMWVGDGLKIAGTTLWSPITPEAYKAMTDSRFVGIDEIHKKHEDARTFLASLPEVDLVITHHVPCCSLVDPKFKDSPFNSGFCSFSSSLVKTRKWVYGHTHSRLNTDKFVCNPLGYPGEVKGPYPPVVFTL